MRGYAADLLRRGTLAYALDGSRAAEDNRTGRQISRKDRLYQIHHPDAGERCAWHVKLNRVHLPLTPFSA